MQRLLDELRFDHAAVAEAYEEEGGEEEDAARGRRQGAVRWVYPGGVTVDGHDAAVVCLHVLPPLPPPRRVSSPLPPPHSPSPLPNPSPLPPAPAASASLPSSLRPSVPPISLRPFVHPSLPPLSPTRRWLCVWF